MKKTRPVAIIEDHPITALDATTIDVPTSAATGDSTTQEESQRCPHDLAPATTSAVDREGRPTASPLDVDDHDHDHPKNIQHMANILGDLLHSPVGQDFCQFFALVSSMEDDKVTQTQSTATSLDSH